MKNIILKIPTFVFALLFFAPILLWFSFIETEEASKYLFPARLIPLIVGTVWSMSLLHYMSSGSKSNKYVPLTYFLLVLEVIFQSLVIYIRMTQGDNMMVNILEIGSIINLLIIGIFMTIIVKKVFYARTTWFVFLEVTTIAIGIITLTPDIKKWEKSDKV